MKNLKRQWKIHRKVKLVGLKKTIKPINWLVKSIGKFLFCRLPKFLATQFPCHPSKFAFMNLVVKVNGNKSGWQRRLTRLLRVCKDVRFKMDEEGRVEISAIGNPSRVLWRVGRSKHLQLISFQFGQCCSYLVMPKTQKEEKKEPNNTNETDKEHKKITKEEENLRSGHLPPFAPVYLPTLPPRFNPYLYTQGLTGSPYYPTGYQPYV